MTAHIIKRGSLYDNILSALVNLLSATNTTEDSTESILQYIFPLSYDTLEEAFIHMGENISDFLTSISERSRWRLKGGGVKISPNREKEK